MLLCEGQKENAESACCHYWQQMNVQLEPFHATGLFLYPLKKSDGFQMFSGGIERDRDAFLHVF